MKTVAKWRSERLGRDVQLVRWGTFGQPVLVFPQQEGRVWDWEEKGSSRTASPLPRGRESLPR